MNFISRYLLKYLLSCAQAEAIELKTILQSIPDARNQYLQRQYSTPITMHKTEETTPSFTTIIKTIDKQGKEIIKPYQKIEQRLNKKRVRGPNINVEQVINIIKGYDYITIKGLARATGNKEIAITNILNRLRKKMPQHFRTYRKNLNGHSILCYKWIP